jgi:hypothetical protein
MISFSYLTRTSILYADNRVGTRRKTESRRGTRSALVQWRMDGLRMYNSRARFISDGVASLETGTKSHDQKEGIKNIRESRKSVFYLM